ncbi:MAG: lysoplasmalogenase [Chloroflexi bacterium]|nr:lysoplasmalogenase [Chloroflexota bacterium]
MSYLTLTALIIITAILHIWGEYSGPDILIYIFKPLTTSLIIMLAVLAKHPVFKRYKIAIIVGLIFSLGGDIILMLPRDLFVFGLASFLIAHLIYIYAFTMEHRLQMKILPIFLAIIYGFGVFSILAPGLGEMRIPVAFYILVILLMGYAAWNLWQQIRNRWALLAFVGALFFVLSDSVLAFNKFYQPFLAARGLSLTTYFTAQWLIARSIVRNS